GRRKQRQHIARDSADPVLRDTVTRKWIAHDAGGRAAVGGRVVDQRAAEAREIAFTEIERDHALYTIGRSLAVTVSAVDEVEEGLVAAVVHVGDQHGPAQSGAELVLPVDGARTLEKSARIELVVTQVVECRAVKIIRAGFRREHL